VLLNTDLHNLRLEGAQTRAFIHPMHVAIALSLLLHAVLLFYILSPRHIPRKPHWTVVEVHLDTAALFQSDAGHTEFPVVNDPPLPADFKSIENQQEKTAVQSAIDARVSSSNSNPQMNGMEIPQELPIPPPGRRPLWSFQGPVLANAQAAYQAQVQRQATANVYNQARMARGQYEAYLKGALATLPLKSHCKIILPIGSKQQVYCESEQDARQVHSVIERFGGIPAIPGDNSAVEIEITPAAEKHSNIVS
jgi:hypothetical protein